ncbi:MAG: DUF4410 domain-containing protein [bacterium]|nr:DUF4410 domain-containing protein [bacterium]
MNWKLVALATVVSGTVKTMGWTLFLVLPVFASNSASNTEQGRVVDGEILDHAVIYQGSISKDQPIRVRLFASENADVGKTGKKKYSHIAIMMKQTAPTALLTQCLEGLREGSFADVAELKREDDPPKNALVIDGEFTMLNPGSQAKRYFVGMGAGRSKICVKGHVARAEDVLLEFEHCRIGAVGLFGGNAAKQMNTDSLRTGGRVAEFMVEWARGAYAE